MSDLCDPWIIAHQIPLSIEFSRQEYWSELPLLSPQDLPGPGIKPVSPALQTDSLPSDPPGKSMQKTVALVIYLIYSSVYLLIPNSQLILLPFQLIF